MSYIFYPGTYRIVEKVQDDNQNLKKNQDDNFYSTLRIFDIFEDSEKLERHLSNAPLASL